MFEINETPECIEMVKERRNKELKLNEFMLSEKNRLAEKVDYYTPLLKICVNLPKNLPSEKNIQTTKTEYTEDTTVRVLLTI